MGIYPKRYKQPTYPTELDMLETFGLEAKESIPQDGYWLYEFEEADSPLKLHLSFNTFENSVQTNLFLHNRSIQTVSYEGALGLQIEKMNQSDALCGEFETDTLKTSLIIQIYPHILVKWATIGDNPLCQS